MNGTGAAEAFTATELGASKAELVPQIPEKWQIRVPIIGDVLPINPQGDHA
jgi:hypothetical protein